MSALRIERRRRNATAAARLGDCVNDCRSSLGMRRAATVHIAICDWPVGGLCDQCARAWQDMWTDAGGHAAQIVTIRAGKGRSPA